MSLVNQLHWEESQFFNYFLDTLARRYGDKFVKVLFLRWASGRCGISPETYPLEMAFEEDKAYEEK